MSSEQQRLTGDRTWTSDSHESVLAERGAQCGRIAKHREEPSDAGCCLHCGTDLDEIIGANKRLILRVFGDEHDRVPACTECTEMGSMSKAVTQRHTSRQVREISPGKAVAREWGEAQ